MTEFQKFKIVLALTETKDQPEKFGDAGRACGRWQMHPEFFFDFFPGRPRPGSTWDEWFEPALQGFWLHYRARYPNVFMLAEIFHLGWRAWERGDHDAEYSARFRTYWETMVDETPKTEVS